MSDQYLQQLKAIQLLTERAKDGLALFRPMEKQIDIITDQASEMLIRGGNRSSKSMTAAAMFAAIARDKPLTLWDGRTVDCRRPWQKNRPLLMWVIGYQLNHIGDTIYRLLFRRGAYKIIRDHQTGAWRTWCPWRPDDVAREHETRPSFPLIPEAEIDNFSWAHKGDRQFTICRLKNGTEIHAYASTGEPKAGDPVDVIWIDEAIQYPQHVAEWQARLSDKRGRLFWSSWPKTSNWALLRMSSRAKSQLKLGKKADVTEHVLKFSENPYIPEEEKAKRIAGWNARERRARDLGEFETDQYLIYPTFNRDIHTAIREPGADDDELSKVLRDRNGEPPADWTRELILDPGTARPAVLLGAIPPPRFGDYLVVYGEVYGNRMDAEQTAAATQGRVESYELERMIIDGKAAVQSPMGVGKTIGAFYEDAFRKRNIVCNQTRDRFIHGSSDRLGRIAQVQSALAIRADGTPRLRIVIDKVPNLVTQLESNTLRVTNEHVAETPDERQENDCRVCLEYWISREPEYVKPQKTAKSTALRAWERRQQRRKLQAKVDDFGGSTFTIGASYTHGN